ncbi:MAG: hypothetical protein H0V91_09980 [Flavisolibacter sp.]|nr:hypothetical protein [Flavisolibacter sp.]
MRGFLFLHLKPGWVVNLLLLIKTPIKKDFFEKLNYGTTFYITIKTFVMNSDKEKDKSGSDIPENTSSKPMDSKKDVKNSPDEKTDQDFPGYPHYPAKEDIMDTRTGNHKVDADLENVSSSNKTGVSQRYPTENDRGNEEAPSTGSGDDDLGIKEGTEADITEEDKRVLENLDNTYSQDNVNLARAALDSSDFDGDELNEDAFGERLSGSDLDIPGETDEPRITATGQGDEENKYYSLGGDRHDDLEENFSSRI